MCNMETYFALLFFSVFTAVNSACQTEFSGKAKWNHAQDDTVVISEPSCLDPNGKHVIRECRNGTWYPETAPACSSFYTNKQCPKHYLEDNNKCLKITRAKKFDDPCEYPGIRYYNHTRVNTTLEFWMPIRKVDASYVYTSIDKRYGREFKFHNGNISSGCFSKSADDFEPSECSALHHHICAYKPARLSKSGADGNYGNVSLVLKFDKEREKLVLRVGAAQKLANMTDGDDYAVYCFTDASVNELKVSVKKKLLFKCEKPTKCNHLVYTIPIKYPNAGQYWCEAYDLHETLIRSNAIVAYKKKKGNEYSLRLVFDMLDDISLWTPEFVYGYLQEFNFGEIFDGMQLEYRVMRITETTEHKLDVVLHISTMYNNNVVGEYHRLLRNIRDKLPEKFGLVTFLSSEVCLPDSENGLHWKLAPIGSKVSAQPLCLGKNGLPVMRKCIGDFTEGAHWDQHAECNVDVELAPQTRELLRISTSEVDASDIKSVKNLTSHPEVLTPLDLFLVASAFNVINISSSEDVVLEDVVDTVQNVLEGNPEIFKKSQIYLNATDSLLDSIDKILHDDSLLREINQEIFFLRRNNVILQISKPFLSNISGIAVYADDVHHMQLGETFSDLNYTDLDISVYVPRKLLESLIDEDDETTRNNLTVIITIFNNDKLFTSGNTTSTTSGRVVSVSIPNFGIYLKEPIPLLFRNEETENRTECSFWEYGTHAPNKTGHWSNSGGNNLGLIKETYSECSFSHLTHFALLILSQRMIVDEGDTHSTDITLGEAFESGVHNKTLNIITLVGCSLSLIGIAGIFITAACFKRWRQKVGTKILIQLSITISLEMIVIHLAGSNFFPNYTLGCNVIGICLHYVVLSKFSWMFVSAILQYIRFVKVLSVLPPRLILKTMLFGWCAPIIPVVTVALFWPNNYNRGSQNFCYPIGNGLYVGLFLPVVLIVGANLVVFIMIMRNILGNKVQGHGRAKKTQKLQIYLGILLFSMLGMPWVFGILAEIVDASILKVSFIYLFCLTATLQGFVLFVFYILLNRDTRRLWMCAFKEDKTTIYK